MELWSCITQIDSKIVLAHVPCVVIFWKRQTNCLLGWQKPVRGRVNVYLPLFKVFWHDFFAAPDRPQTVENYLTQSPKRFWNTPTLNRTFQSHFLFLSHKTQKQSLPGYLAPSIHTVFHESQSLEYGCVFDWHRVQSSQQLKLPLWWQGTYHVIDHQSPITIIDLIILQISGGQQMLP
jgi:hypothetical protein